MDLNKKIIQKILQNEKLFIDIIECIKFYADIDTYFGVGFIPDNPCGDFVNDFTRFKLFGYKPGRKARKTLKKIIKEIKGLK